MQPSYVFFNGFENEDLEEDMRARGYQKTNNNKSASFVIFADDPKKTLFRLPPRQFGSRDEFIEDMRKNLEKRGWKILGDRAC